MALVNCRECGKSVSAEAKACPSCGIARPVPVPSHHKFINLGLTALAIGLIIFLANQCSSPSAPVDHSPAAVRKEADFQRALQLVITVKKNLNDPSSLDISGATATDTAVAITYRAKNAFGALIVNRAVLTSDGAVAIGSDKAVSALWNKHIANKPSTDLTSSVRGARTLGAY